MWDDLVGEPEGTQSLDCTWNCSRTCFQARMFLVLVCRVISVLYQGTLSCCYILLTTLYAPLFALCAGINFACLSFTHIWAYGPWLRTCKISCALYRKVVQIVLAATMAPCCETAGRDSFLTRVTRYCPPPDGGLPPIKKILNFQRSSHWSCPTKDS